MKYFQKHQYILLKNEKYELHVFFQKQSHVP